MEVSYEGEGIQQYFHIVSGGSLGGLSFCDLNGAWRILLWKFWVWPIKAWWRWDNFGWNFWCLALVTDHGLVILHEREVGSVPYAHEINLEILETEWHHWEVSGKVWGKLLWESKLSFLSILFVNITLEDEETGDRNSWEESLSHQDPLSINARATSHWEGVMDSWSIHGCSEKHEETCPSYVKFLLEPILIFYIK